MPVKPESEGLVSESLWVCREQIEGSNLKAFFLGLRVLGPGRPGWERYSCKGLKSAGPASEVLL